jgi:hypothetical protein
MQPAVPPPLPRLLRQVILVVTLGALASLRGAPTWILTPNFRLTDQLGVSHELYYQSTSKVVVLVFTSLGSAQAGQTAATLNAIRASYPATTLTLWQIDSDLGADQTAIAAEQSNVNNTTPVLLDRSQIVAAEYGAVHQLETIVISTATWSVAYRGPLDSASAAIAAVAAGKNPASSASAFAAGAPLLDLPPAMVPDYATAVAPIVLRDCLQCHSPGNIAPFVYNSYASLSAHATELHADLLTQRMAPWHADASMGAYSNSHGLTSGEANTLYNWVVAGAPRGNGGDPLLTATPPAGGAWPLGTPDLVITIPKQTLPATGTVAYQYVTVPVPLVANTWMRAAIVRPGNPAVVHHALVFEGTKQDVILNAGGLGGYFAGFVPGEDQQAFPTGTGKLIKKGESITFQIHYVTDGQVESDQTQVGFYFASAPPALSYITASAYTPFISIGPGVPNYQRSASFTPSTTKDVMLYEINPHMHFRGKNFQYQAVYPNGTSEIILNVPQYDFLWQSGYRLAVPKRLPAGTTLNVVGTFDNSAQNVANPDPTATVTFGEQTTDEMFVGYLNYAELPDLQGPPPIIPANQAARGSVGQPLAVALKALNGATFRTAAALPAGLTLNSATGLISGVPTGPARLSLPYFADNAAGTAAANLDIVVTGPPGPAFAVQPLKQTVTAGSTVVFNASVNGAGGVSYQWLKDGAAIAGATNARLVLSGNAVAPGNYAVAATDSLGTITSTSAQLAVSSSADSGHFRNLSVLASASSTQTLTVGFAIGGGTNGSKPILIRAAGPALAGFGLGGTLADPVLTLHSGSAVLDFNDDWGTPASAQPGIAAATAAAFAFPFSTSASLDAALYETNLVAGGYSAVVTGKSAANGLALAEVYDAATGAFDVNAPRLTNLSCLTTVGPSGILTAGFVVGGSTAKTVMIRGIGPALTGFGLAGVIADPLLALHSAASGVDQVLAANTGWGGTADIVATAKNVSAFALPTTSSADSVLLLTLAPGSYSAQVMSASGAGGLAMIEVYEVP